MGFEEVKQRAIKDKRESLACFRHEQCYSMNTESYKRYRRGRNRCSRCGLKLTIHDYQRKYNKKLSELLTIVNLNALKEKKWKNSDQKIG